MGSLTAYQQYVAVRVGSALGLYHGVQRARVVASGSGGNGEPVKVVLVGQSCFAFVCIAGHSLSVHFQTDLAYHQFMVAAYVTEQYAFDAAERDSNGKAGLPGKEHGFPGHAAAAIQQDMNSRIQSRTHSFREEEAGVACDAPAQTAA